MACLAFPTKLKVPTSKCAMDMKLNLRHGSIWSLTHSSKNGNRCIHQCKASWYILVGKPLGLAVWRVQFWNVTICQGSWCIWLNTPTDRSQFLTISEPLSDQWHIASHEKWRCNEETPKHIWTPPMEASGVVLDMAQEETGNVKVLKSAASKVKA